MVDIYGEVYIASFENEMQKIAASAGLMGTVARKLKRLPTFVGAQTERFRRAAFHRAAAKRATSVAKGTRRPVFSMGSPGDLTSSYHRGMYRKNINKTILPAVGRGLATAGAVGSLGVGGSMYFKSRYGKNYEL
ncbi:MAG: hypothetical protein DRP09_10365 [Candidatus Thorarchaeota archaeon]|nr:MAG: hypothetical protein DRP09_10365 [Candidatus Thorarchaeota archaeon]